MLEYKHKSFIQIWINNFWWELYCGPEYALTGKTIFNSLKDGSAWWYGGRWYWIFCPKQKEGNNENI